MMRLFSILMLLTWGFFKCLSQEFKQLTFDQLSNQVTSYHQNNFQELVYVTTSSQFLISGETLYFSIYCLNKGNNLLSNLSSLAYVMLVDENKKVIMKSKVTLKKGRGYGDFFIPSSMSSGNYYLVVYTALMRNQPQTDIFQTELNVINPFTQVNLKKVSQKTSDVQISLNGEGNSFIRDVKNRLMLEIEGDFKFPGTTRLTNENDVMSTITITEAISGFTVIPTGDSPRIILTDSNGTNYFNEFPRSSAVGISLSVGDSRDAYTILLRSPTPETAYLIGVNKDVIIYFEEVSIDGETKLSLSKNKLPSGITSLVLLNPSSEVLASRLIYVKPDNKNYSLISDKKSYGTREKVRLRLRSILKSDLSIIVKKIDEVPDKANSIQSKVFFQWNGLDEKWSQREESQIHNYLATETISEFPWSDSTVRNLNYDFIPDFHGDMITGTLKSKTTSNPITDTDIHLSVPGKQFQFISAKTNSNGEFYFNINSTFEGKDLYIQALTSEDYELEIVDGFFENFDFLKTSPFDLDSNLLNFITEKSLHTQIENAYFDVKKAEHPDVDNLIFYGQPDKTYKLDEYTRFPTMLDVFREITASVLVRKKKDNYSLHLLDSDGGLERFDPLVLIDGLPVTNINDLMTYDALKVDRVEVIKRKYYYGPVNFDGIISLRTKEGILHNFPIEDHVKKVSYSSFQLEKNYYNPNYDVDPESRIPDYRDILFWNPKTILERNTSLEIDFFTSDVTGAYSVRVEGFNEIGNPVLLTLTFDVIPN